MGSKWKPRQLVESKPRNYSAKGMIEAGTGKGGSETKKSPQTSSPMRDRQDRRPKERDDLRDLQAEEEFYNEQDIER